MFVNAFVVAWAAKTEKGTYTNGQNPTNSTPVTKNTRPINIEETFDPPKVFKNDRGEFTNGKYTLSETKMIPHTNGDNSTGKSQFLFNVDANKAALDAAVYADKYNLWNDQNAAKIPVSNGNIGVLGRTGELTN